MYFPHAFRKSFLPSTVASTTLTATSTNTTTGFVLPLTAVTNIAAGQAVVGAGIQPGTVVASVASLNVTLSLPITAAIASGAIITYGIYITTTTAAVGAPNVLNFASTAGVSVGQSVSGTGIATGTVVNSFVANTSVTLSSNVTATVNNGTGAITFGSSVAPITTGSTGSLTAGQIGFFSPDGVAVQAASAKPFMIAQGSYFTNDKISPALGGYKESVKTKMINPKYISRVIKITAKSARQMIVQVPVAVNTGLAADTTYRLRVDAKGSPALRFLSHNMYRTLDAYTGCANAADPTLLKDPVPTLLNWADQINTSLIFNTMVQARVYTKVGTTVAGTFTASGTGLTAQTLTFASGNTTGVAIGQKIVATGTANLPASSFVTALAATATATHAATGVTVGTSTYVATSGGTTFGVSLVTGYSISGAGFPVGSYVSAQSSTSAFTITYPTQLVAPTISGTITASASATVTYPTQATAPVSASLPTTGIKAYNDVYSGALSTYGYNASVVGGAVSTPTYLPATNTESGVGGSLVTGSGVATNATIGAIGSTSGAQLYNMNPADAATFTVDAHIELYAAYIETKFGICTFTPTDFYGLEPLLLFTSIVDESGDPCVSAVFTGSNSATGTNTSANDATVIQTAVQASGIGETVLRDFILSDRYLQNAYPDSSRVESLRMREIEQNPALSKIDRTSLYDQVMILHSVPRFNNPTATFDNDQYLLVFNVPTGTATTALTNYIVSSVIAAGGTIPTNTAGGTFEQF